MTGSIRVYLSIESRALSTEQMADFLGLRPDRFWRIGDPRGRTGKLFETSSWTAEVLSNINSGSDQSPGEQIQESVRRLLSRLRPASREIRKLALENSATFVLSILVTDVPDLQFEVDVLGDLSELGVPLEIEIILSA